MSRKSAKALFMLLLFCTLTVGASIQRVQAYGTIYIKADGNIDPPGSPIQQNVNTYTLTSDIYDSIIVVQKSGVLLDGAGYTMHGAGGGSGIEILGLTGVSVINIIIDAYDNGIYVGSSDHIAISNAYLTNNYNAGIWLSDSSHNTISQCTLTANILEGIYVLSSSYNIINRNQVTGTIFDGIYIYSSSYNDISANTLTSNGFGISLYSFPPDSTGNRVFYNTFASNTNQGNPNSNADIWDRGYPLGGNYWSDYTGTDTNHDGLGDTPYIINSENTDNYPLMHPWKMGDTNYDGSVNVLDLIITANALGSRPGDPNWNPRADVKEDGAVNVLDLITIAGKLGT